LEAACKKHGVPLQLVKELLNIQRENAGRGRQTGITDEFDTCLGGFLEDELVE
jgi:hypothetical protein